MSQVKFIVLGALALGIAVGAHAQRVPRDTATGELRAPTATESKSLENGRRAARAVGVHSGRVNPQAVRMHDGTVMQELTTDSLMYSVARKNADGSVSQYCVPGETTALRILNGKQAPTQSFAKAGKEQAYEVK